MLIPLRLSLSWDSWPSGCLHRHSSPHIFKCCIIIPQHLPPQGHLQGSLTPYTCAPYLPRSRWANSLWSSCCLFSQNTFGTTSVNPDPLRSKHKVRVKNARILLSKKPERKALGREPEKAGRYIRLWGKSEPKWRGERRLGDHPKMPWSLKKPQQSILSA